MFVPENSTREHLLRMHLTGEKLNGCGCGQLEISLVQIEKMAMHSSAGVHPDVRSDFSTKEGTYRNVKASVHCRPSRQPLFGKELSPVQVSCVSCKGKDGLCEWIVFNSGKELYFYPFQGVGKVSKGGVILYVPTRGLCLTGFTEQ